LRAEYCASLLRSGTTIAPSRDGKPLPVLQAMVLPWSHSEPWMVGRWTGSSCYYFFRKIGNDVLDDSTMLTTTLPSFEKSNIMPR
jgi:hypothetical protein